ncbi:MAG: efflux RND transporter permease subunit [Myxococcota bacterium]
MTRVVAWFARNPVAANLLMALLIVGGAVTVPAITQKEMPDITIDLITVSVEYRGAAPQEAEEGVCVRVEESLEGVEGIDTIRSTSMEGLCTVRVELLSGADASKALDDVKTRVDALDTLPEETEKPVISRVVIRRSVTDLAIAGDVDERSLREVGQRIRDEIAAIPGITQVDLTEARPYEISIEVSEAMLRRYGLSFDAVADAVRRSSLDLPGGSIKTEGGEILLRTKGQAYRGLEFERLVLLTRPDGTRLTLGEVATVRDGFKDTDQMSRFDGKPSVMVRVFRVGDQDVIDISDKVKAYVARAQATLPAGISLVVWRDSSKSLRARLDTLFRNGRSGLIVVMLIVTLFLRPRLAFWVTMGVPVAFLGALFTLPMIGITINSISTFGFIMVLGMLVDDAIVVGESVHTEQERSSDPLEGAIRGTQSVSTPVIFGVLTSIAAFSPFLTVPGTMGQIMTVIATVVMLCLAYSLVESQLVLPAHLAHGLRIPPVVEVLMMAIPLLALTIWGLSPSLRTAAVAAAAALAVLVVAAWGGGLRRIALRILRGQERFSRGLGRFIEDRFARWLRRTLEWRYTTLAVAVALLLWTVGVIASGRMHFSFFPPLEGEYVSAELTMPQGTPAWVTADAVAQIERAAERLREEIDRTAELDPGYPSFIRHVNTVVGEQPFGDQQSQNPANAGGASGVTGGHLGEVTLELVPAEHRSLKASELAQRWRELTGPVPDAVELVFASSLFSIGDAINIQLQGPDVAQLSEAADRLKHELASFPGVIDITDSFRAGKREVKLAILPSAEALGLTLQDLARQVRQGFYGEEAQRIQRGRDDVRVMVRYPEDERHSLGDLETMRIRTPSGAEVPFSSVARATLGRGYASIRRADRQRVINVTADVDRSRTTAGEVFGVIREGALPRILADYPGMSYRLEGSQREQARSAASLARWYVIALLGIFALLAIPLRSYFQPLLIMSVIPFGLVGSILGHLLLGHHMSFMSVTGFVAASGVVVNASLVLVHYVNQRRDAGIGAYDAVLEAGVARFRPIVLTSLTTFGGLSPLMLERSVQAQFLVPMAISLAFGVLFAAGITLLVVPSGYLVQEDLRRLVGHSRRPAGPQESSMAGAAGLPQPLEDRIR